MSDVAYNAGLEIRYAIAASRVDPIQHIPEVDAIIERRLAEARKAAFIEAAEIADERAKYWRERVPVDTMAMTKEEMREIFKEKSLALENIALSLREKSKEERS
ncbi:hypothetical protein BTE77_06935 [Ensifer adhaerens]|nr:hypothetical protein BTE77_06935 [Ensifer adhaerens]